MDYIIGILIGLIIGFMTCLALITNSDDMVFLEPWGTEQVLEYKNEWYKIVPIIREEKVIEKNNKENQL